MEKQSAVVDGDLIPKQNQINSEWAYILSQYLMNKGEDQEQSVRPLRRSKQDRIIASKLNLLK